jgi:hypothetical protein
MLYIYIDSETSTSRQRHVIVSIVFVTLKWEPYGVTADRSFSAIDPAACRQRLQTTSRLQAVTAGRGIYRRYR